MKKMKCLSLQIQKNKKNLQKTKLVKKLNKNLESHELNKINNFNIEINSNKKHENFEEKREIEIQTLSTCNFKIF